MLEMILLDWTRMGGGTYCLAGAVAAQGYRIVRPLPAKNRTQAQRKFGWWFRPFEGHRRWEVYELTRPETAEPQPPHLEDIWVAALRPRGRVASAQERRAILQATLAKPGALLFGAPLTALRSVASLRPGGGARSLVTIKVPAASIVFGAACRAGALEPDFRVELPVPELGMRSLPVKDHHLLLRAKAAGDDLAQQIATLQAAIRDMGNDVAVRLGLSRGFATTDGAAGACWLMADGFFSWSDPQS